MADGAFLECDYNDKKPHMSIKQASSLSKFVSNKLLISHLSYNYSDSEVENEIKDYKIVDKACYIKKSLIKFLL